MSVYVSSLLTATAATVNADPASTRTWQWQRNGVDIPGATNSTYSAAPADIGSNLFVVQTETNFLGSNNASASVGPVVAFSPIAFFGDGSPGWWFDNDDITTLFQDSAGTTPVTAVEQFVGLQLDKSKGLVPGPELVTNGDFSAGTTGWTAFRGTGTVTDGVYSFTPSLTFGGPRQSVTLVVGKVYKVTATVAGNAVLRMYLNGTSGTPTAVAGTTAQRTLTLFATATSVSGEIVVDSGDSLTAFTVDNISVRELPGNHRYAPASGNRPIWSKLVNLLTKTEQINDVVWVKNGTATTPSANTLNLPAVNDYIYQSGVPSAGAQMTLSAILSGTGTVSLVAYDNVAGFRISNVTLTATPTQYSFTFTFGAGASDRRAGIGRLTAATATSVTVNGADLRPANQATGTMPLYQRVNTSTDYETNGFPGYLKADGIDDFLQTNSIDFTATDKLSLCVGLRQLANGNYGGIAGIGPTVNDAGSFLYWLRSSAGGGQQEAYARGSTSATTGAATTNAATTVPDTFIATIQYDLSQTSVTNEIQIRNNGAVASSTGTSTCGTGNFGNYAATFFQYNSSNRFNGYEYGNVAVGKLLTADQLAALELYTENQMKLALLPTDYQNLQTSAGDNLTDSSGLNLLYAQPIY